ncbi:Hypothetical_protein [Hexamita inflata]|uniref:Hypothetical_protein n=1 Tax=Hexamita inflata TaxID=28002 RepID=A0AA86TT03_9EUKA|nr:Hypothetical protein HINF_LOCUS15181 [Hexamita inflata]
MKSAQLQQAPYQSAQLQKMLGSFPGMCTKRILQIKNIIFHFTQSGMMESHKRSKISDDDQKRIDTIIIHHVCSYLKLPKFDSEEAQEYQRNRSIKRTRTVKWTKIDKVLGLKYATKSYSYKRFVDVILPNLLPPCPKEIVNPIIKYYEGLVRLQLDLQEKVKLPSGLSSLTKIIREQVKTKFDLCGSEKYSYKKLIDKINHKVKQRIIKCCNAPSNANLIVFQYFDGTTEHQDSQNDEATNSQTRDSLAYDSIGAEQIQLFAALPNLDYADVDFELSCLLD